MFALPSQRIVRRAVALSIAVACCAPGAVASAQRIAATLYGAGGPGTGSPNAMVVFNLSTGQTESSRPGTGTGGSVFTSDGGHLLLTRRLSSSPQTLELYNTSTRSVTPMAIAFNPGVSHPRAQAVFGYDSGALSLLDPAGARSLDACGVEPTLGFDITLDGSAVVALCANPFVPGSNAHAVTVDSRSGAHVSDIDLGTATARALVVNPDASRIMLLEAVAANSFALVLIDTASNQRSTVFVDAPFPAGAVVGGCSFAGVTRARDRAAVQCQWTDFTTTVLRTELVEFATGSQRPLASVPGLGTMHFSPDDAIAIVGTGAVSVLDVAADRLLASYPVSAAIHDVAFPPGPPVGLMAAVTGSHVQLDWSLPASSPVATAYLLEAGTAPGLRNLLTMPLGAATRFEAAAVPVGRYYVRVRAINATGTGGASNEVVVDVP